MIEDIQKVNKLAQELLDQGVTEDREDAVKRAQEMLNKNIEPNQTQTNDSERSLQKDNAKLEVTKCMDLINKTRDQMSRQIDIFSQKMNEIIKEINDIRDQLKSGTSKTASETNIEPEKPLKEAVAEPEEEHKEAEPESKPEKQEKLQEKESHPKRGNWKSDDVSIEKMFYFGNK